MSLSPRSPLVLAVAVAALAVSGCGSDADSGSAEPSTSASPSETPTQSSEASSTATPSAKSNPDAVTVDLTVRGDSVEPGPSVVKVERGKPVVFRIDSDRPGGLHVHSSPEQTPTFKKGKSTITITLKMPGVVEVEEHEADVLVAQLQVR